jgi:hypothetical protein
LLEYSLVKGEAERISQVRSEQAPIEQPLRVPVNYRKRRSVWT